MRRAARWTSKTSSEDGGLFFPPDPAFCAPTALRKTLHNRLSRPCAGAFAWGLLPLQTPGAQSVRMVERRSSLKVALRDVPRLRTGVKPINMKSLATVGLRLWSGHALWHRTGFFCSDEVACSVASKRLAGRSHPRYSRVYSSYLCNVQQQSTQERARHIVQLAIFHVLTLFFISPACTLGADRLAGTGSWWANSDSSAPRVSRQLPTSW